MTRTFLQEYDVLVAGGGPSGIAAAVAAARQGSKTALMERYGILGGMLTSGHVNPILGATAPGTFLEEVLSRLGVNRMRTRNGEERGFDAEGAKRQLLELAVEAGVDVFLQTPVVEVVREGQRVTGLVIATQEGLRPLGGRVTVDATGDGFVAARAGADCRVGREEDGRCQPATLEFTVYGVEEERGITCWGGTDPVTLPDGRGYASLCREAAARGELPENVTIVRIHRTGVPGERGINATQANGCDTLTPEGILGAEVILRAQIGPILAFLRKYAPGFEGCRLKGTGSTLGVRETRRVMGDYVISDRDMEEGARHREVVVHNAWYLIDIHNPAGGGQAEGHSQPAQPYDIPYGSLLPRGVEGLLTCGRCISGSHRAHGSYRVSGICFATGQAAGTAAALAAQQGVTPRELAVGDLQEALTQAGVTLFG